MCTPPAREDRPRDTSQVRPSRSDPAARLKRAIESRLFCRGCEVSRENISRRMLARASSEDSHQTCKANMAVRGLALCSSAACKEAPRHAQPFASLRQQPARVPSQVCQAAQWPAAAAGLLKCPRRSRPVWKGRTSCGEQSSPLSNAPPPPPPPSPQAPRRFCGMFWESCLAARTCRRCCCSTSGSGASHLHI